jgi:hypothetical protein
MDQGNPGLPQRQRLVTLIEKTISNGRFDKMKHKKKDTLERIVLKLSAFQRNCHLSWIKMFPKSTRHGFSESLSGWLVAVSYLRGNNRLIIFQTMDAME